MATSVQDTHRKSNTTSERAKAKQNNNAPSHAAPCDGSAAPNAAQSPAGSAKSDREATRTGNPGQAKVCIRGGMSGLGMPEADVAKPVQLVPLNDNIRPRAVSPDRGQRAKPQKPQRGSKASGQAIFLRGTLDPKLAGTIVREKPGVPKERGDSDKPSSMASERGSAKGEERRDNGQANDAASKSAKLCGDEADSSAESMIGSPGSMRKPD